MRANEIFCVEQAERAFARAARREAAAAMITAIQEQPLAESLHGEPVRPSADTGAALCGASENMGEVARDAQPEAGPDLPSEKLRDLRARRSRAAELLASGMSVREVADALGIHRGTLFRWRQSDAMFRAAIAERSQQLAGDLRDVARGLLVKAIGYFDRAMAADGSRQQVAAAILRNRQLWSFARPGEEAGGGEEG